MIRACCLLFGVLALLSSCVSCLVCRVLSFLFVVDRSLMLVCGESFSVNRVLFVVCRLLLGVGRCLL